MRITNINCRIEREIKNITEEPEEIFLLAAESSTLESLGGTNKKPQIVNLSEYNIYITGDLITLKAEAIDLDNNSLAYYYSSPFNSSGQWQTNQNSSGDYSIFVQVSDGSLTDEGYITFKVVSNNSYLISTFSDGRSEINLTFNSSGNQTVYLTIPDYANVTGAILNITGYFLNGTYPTSNFQEPYPQVTCYVSGDDPNKAIDRNWNTYYDYGSLTEICVEVNNLTVPTNYTHIELHLRLRVWDGDCCDEPGVLDIYNYSNQAFYRFFGNVTPFNDGSSYKDYYFDIYRDDVGHLWQNNGTHKVYKTILEDFIGANTEGQIQWHYDAAGVWASQKVYESEVRFYKLNPYPHYPRLDVGNNTIYEWNYAGELILSDLSEDFYAQLNDYISGYNLSGNITVPLIFHSQSAGIINIKNLKIYYKTDIDNDTYDHLLDCNDNNASISPEAAEICADGVDNDCDGNTDSYDTGCVGNLTISSLSSLYSNKTLHILQFEILNNGSSPSNDVSWQFDTDDNNIINGISNLSSLATGESAFVYILYNFSQAGDYGIKASTTGKSHSISLSSSSSFSLSVGDLTITYFNDTKIGLTNVVFEIEAKNHLLENLTNVNWSLKTGDGQIIDSISKFDNIKPNETVFIFVFYNIYFLRQ